MAKQLINIRSQSNGYVSDLLTPVNIYGDTKINGNIYQSSSNSTDYYDNKFISGYLGAGFRLQSSNSGSSLQLDDLVVRNILRAHIFQKDIVRASNGYLFISDCSQIVSSSIISQTGIQYDIIVKESVFQSGDMLWYKDIEDNGSGLNITGIKGTITSGSTGITIGDKQCFKYGFTANHGTGTLKVGGTIVRVGNINSTQGRMGSLYFDASSNNSPYMDVYDGINSWNNNSQSISFSSYDKLKVRLGNLNGIVDQTFGQLDGYGLYAVNNIYIKGVINALAGGNIAGWNIGQNSLYKNNLQLNSNDGYIKIGDNVRFDKNGQFILKTDQNNYIKQQNNEFQIKTNKLELISNNIKISSDQQIISIGNIIGFKSGNGIFIGKDLSSCPSDIDDVLFASGSGDLLSIDGETASAINYSNYKMFIGQDSGSYFIYDGKNVQLNGTIKTDKGIIGGWTISSSSLYNNNVNIDSNGKIYIGNGNYNNTDTSFYVDKDGRFSLKDKLYFSGSVLNINGTITSTSGTIGGWNIGIDSINKNFIEIKSITSSYIQNDTYPNAKQTLLFNRNITGSYTLKTNVDDQWMSQQILNSGSTTTQISPMQQVTVNLVYNISSSVPSGFDPNVTYSDIFLTVYQEDSGQQINIYNYKLIGGNVDRKLVVQFKNEEISTKNVKFKLVGIQIPPKNSQYYDVCNINQFQIKLYQPKIQIAQNGMFIFNSPSNYIKMGYQSQSNGVYSGISQFMGQSIQVDDLIIKKNLYHYGKTFIAGTNLLGTTSDRFTINTDANGQNATLYLKKSNTLQAKIQFNGDKVLFDKVIDGTITKANDSDKWNGYSFDDYLNQSVKTGSNVKFNELQLSQADGTSPMTITSKTLVSNLNVEYLGGNSSSYYLDWSNTTNKPSPQITLTMSGDVHGLANLTLSQLQSGTMSISTTIQPNSVILGTDTVGNYVISMSNGNGISISGTAGQGWTPTISHQDITTSTGTSTTSTVVGSLAYNSRGHITQYKTINIYTLFSGSSPITFNNGTSSLNTSSNLKLTDNKLDTIQDIQSSSSPTFTQLILLNTASSSSNAVRADRTLQITTNNGIVIDNSSSLDLTDNRSWSLGLTGQAKSLHQVGTGIIAISQSGTASNRTITGTDNRISLNNGDGVSGNPTVDISQTYIGQTSINTLGTITTGSWNATTIDILYGGTNNTSFKSNSILYYENSKITSSNAYWKNGKLGIGVQNPLQVLDINGNILLSNQSGSYIRSNGDLNLKPTQSNYIRLLNDTTLYNQGSFSSVNFNSNIFGSGFKLFKNQFNSYQMQLDDLFVRGTLHASVFQKDVVRASNGYLFISDADQIVINSTLIPNPDITQYIYIKDGYFQSGDLLLCKCDNSVGNSLQLNSYIFNTVGDVSQVWIDTNGVIYTSSVDECVSAYKLPIKVVQYGNGDIKLKTDNTIVRIGNTLSTYRQGSLFFDASSNNAPYMSVYDGVNSVDSFHGYQKEKVRLGQLQGIVDNDFGHLNGYGLYAVNNVYIKGVINALQGGLIAGWNIGQNSLYKNNLQINSNQGFIKIGDNVQFRQNGYFILKTDQNNYIKHQDGQFEVKTNKLQLQSDKINISSTQQKITIGNIIGFKSGSGIYIGRDLSSYPFGLIDTLSSNGVDELSFNETASSAYNYSQYKMFVGQSDGNYFIYDGKNVQINGTIKTDNGLIAGWNISSSSIYKDNAIISSNGYISFGTIPPISYGNNTGAYLGVENNKTKFSLYSDQSNYLQWDGTKLILKSSNFQISQNGNVFINGSITSSNGKIGCWNISNTSIYSGSNEFSNINSLYFGTGGLSLTDKFKVDDKGKLTATDAIINGYISSSNGNIGGWNLNEGSLSSGNTVILANTSSYWDSNTDIPSPTDKLEYNLMSLISIPYTVSHVNGTNVQVTSSINLSQYSGNSFGVNILYHYYNNISNGIYLTAQAQLYQISGSNQISKKRVILQRDSSQSGRQKSIGFLYKSNQYDNSKNFNLRLIIRRADIQLQSDLYINAITFNTFKVTFGQYQPLTELSQNGLFVFNNPESYIKVGANTQIGTNTLDIKADQMVVKNITILQGIYTNAKTYGVTQIAGTTANKFTINTDGDVAQSSLVFNGANNKYISIITNNNKLQFKDENNSLIKLNAEWNGMPISMSSQVTGTLPFSNGGTGITTINQYKLLSSYTNSNSINEIGINDILSSSGNGLTFNTANGILTMSLAQNITTDGDVQFKSIKVGTNPVVTQDRSIYINSGSGVIITGNITQSLSSDIGWNISHATYSTSTESSSNQFISNLTVDNGHVITITKSNFDNSHNHYINSMSFGIGQNILITTASNSILTVDSNNKTVTFDISPKTLTFGSGISASSGYNGLADLLIDHKVLQSGTYNSSSTDTDAVLCELVRDDYGHVTSNKYLKIYSLFSGNNPITFTSGAIGLNYNIDNFKLDTDTLNTIQDISTSSNVTFNSLKIKSGSYYTDLSIHQTKFNLDINNSINISGSIDIYNSGNIMRQKVEVGGNIVFSII